MDSEVEPVVLCFSRLSCTEVAYAGYRTKTRMYVMIGDEIMVSGGATGRSPLGHQGTCSCRVVRGHILGSRQNPKGRPDGNCVNEEE